MKKKSLTSGEIADYCEVSLRTAIRWIEKGHLKAYKLPGRGDNRVKVDDFVRFLKKNNMPLPEEFQSHAPRVLIIDDDNNFAQVVSRTLEKQGFATQVVTDSFQAGAFLGSFDPDVITIDINMPGLNGHEVIKFTRSSKKYEHIKILVISGVSQEELDKALSFGADDILEKPYERQTLIEKISDLLGVECHE